MWTKVYFNLQSIQRETPRSVLIKMPNHSKYKGYSFWHPAKLVRREGGKGYHLSFSFSDDFNFNVIKYGQGRYNSNEIISEYELDAEDMKEVWQVVNNSIQVSVSDEIQKKKDENHLEIIVEEIIPKKESPLDSNEIDDLRL